jgi:hypothetical protein
MTEWQIKRLERMANREDFTPEYSFINDLQCGILELAAELRKVKGLPPEQATDEDDD